MLRLRSSILLYALAVLLCAGAAGCADVGEPEPFSFPTDSLERLALFQHYMDEGNRFYAEGAGYPSFQKSLRYFDSVQALATATSDSAMLIDAVFARGRIYDAWNKEPRKTIQYFSEAAGLMRTRIHTRPRYAYFYPYLRHLTAHAYEKARDTAGATRTLRALYADLAALPPAARDTLNFIPEMALVATEVGAWSLADSILAGLTRRSLIANDPETYNYLDHYYLTQARLDAYHRRVPHSAYADSLASVYSHTTALLDKRYYSRHLAALYDTLGDIPRSHAFLKDNGRWNDSLEAGGAVEQMQAALVRSEVAAERRKTEYETDLRGARARTVWGLAGALAVISVLAFYLGLRGKKFRAQSAELRAVNKRLDEKVAQVELLNKEIQHRVKNNLHMIYSLLHMQERRTENEETIEQLQAARLRVESIAALHNQLLAGGKGDVDFGAYMRGLISSVVSCLSDDKKVVTHLSTETINIPPNSYLALSLVLNEWVTNSIKYAAPRDGLIEITVDIRNEEAEVCISYRDNGAIPSPPQGGAGGGAPGLGTQIVQLLTKQMTARLTTPAGQPYHYSLCIPHGA